MSGLAKTWAIWKNFNFCMTKLTKKTYFVKLPSAKWPFLYHFEVICTLLRFLLKIIFYSVRLRTQNLIACVLKKYKKASLNLRERDQEFSCYADAIFSFNFQGNPKVQLGFSKILTFYTNSRGSWLTPQTCTFKV